MGARNHLVVNRLMGSIQMLFMFMLPFLVVAQTQNPNSSDGTTINLTWQRIVAGFVLILVGIMLTFRGYRHYRCTMFLAGFIVGCVIVYSILTNVEPSQGWNHRQIIYVFASIGGGLIIGAFCWLFHRFMVWLLGGLAGLVIALYILAWRNEGLIRGKGGRVGLLAGAPALGMILGLFMGRRILVPASAIVGAYVTIIGVDLFARTGFSQSINKFFTTNSHVDYVLTTNLYIMLGVVGGLIVLGLLYQTLAWNNQQRMLLAQGRTVHDYNNDWSLFGRKRRAIRPDPTYPEGGYTSSYNNTATTTTPGVVDSNVTGYDNTDYTEKQSWNPFKRNKTATTAATVPSDYPDNRVSYSSNAALNQ